MSTIETPVESELDTVEPESGRVIRLVEPQARILSVSESEADHAALRRIVESTRWRFTSANTCREARRRLRYSRALAVFCERTLPDGTWKDVLDHLSDLDQPPFLVVISRLADDSLWSEVLNRGGYDVLAKPVVEDQVRRVLDWMWSHRARPRSLRAAF
jgi:DNA-binding NtrC family response regulator